MCSLGFNAFLIMWLGFLGLMIMVITLALVWAVRSRQFLDQERARSLPLKSGIPTDKKPSDPRGK